MQCRHGENENAKPTAGPQEVRPNTKKPSLPWGNSDAVEKMSVGTVIFS